MEILIVIKASNLYEALRIRELCSHLCLKILLEERHFSKAKWLVFKAWTNNFLLPKQGLTILPWMFV